VPELTIVLNHLGGLTRIRSYANRDEEVLAEWRSRNRRPEDVFQCQPQARRDRHAADGLWLACPREADRLGGTGGIDGPLMSYCIEQLGPDRCMFESNFPVDKVSFSHHGLFNAFKRFSKGYSAAERANLFHDTAARAYRIGTD
jgi:predicted TIM-barrel fold metal-dependent hydrolase